MASPILQQSGILQASVVTMMEWARTEYARYSGTPLTVRLVTAPNNLRQADVPSDPKKADGGALAYPFALFLMGSIEIDGGRTGFANTHGSRGTMTNRNIDGGFAEFETMRPVAVSFGVNFRTGSFDDVMNWAHALLLAAPRVQLWIVSDEGFAVECSVELDSSLTIPPLDSTEAGSNYAFETTFRLNTRIGVVTRHRLIQNIRMEVLEPDNPTTARTYYTGTMAQLLDRVGFDVHDLFDPTTGVGRYTHRGAA